MGSINGDYPGQETRIYLSTFPLRDSKPAASPTAFSPFFTTHFQICSLPPFIKFLLPFFNTYLKISKMFACCKSSSAVVETKAAPFAEPAPVEDAPTETAEEPKEEVEETPAEEAAPVEEEPAPVEEPAAEEPAADEKTEAEQTEAAAEEEALSKGYKCCGVLP